MEYPISTPQWVILMAGTVFLVILSRRSLLNPRSHGFYRFFAFEACLILVVVNQPLWIRNALSPVQVISWILLALSLLLVVAGTMALKKLGKQKPRDHSPETFHFENTSVLIKTGIFRYIRHPMYSSLLFLAWGACLKQINWLTILAALGATVSVFATAGIEEAENLKTFGDDYRSYMTETRRFIPYVL